MSKFPVDAPKLISPDRRNEGAITGNIPNGQARPLPAGGVCLPGEILAAEFPGFRQRDYLAVRFRTIAPHDLREAERKRPGDLGLCDELVAARGDARLRKQHFA